MSDLSSWQAEFLDLALATRALKFGDFTLKSGRRSPYFFNAGAFTTGSVIDALGNCYAEAILACGIEFDGLFGPAYKGIPLAVSVAAALHRRGRDVPFAFNRKEVKDHGEGGRLVGQLGKRVLIIDDVMTSGTAVRESLKLLSEEKVRPAGVVVALDRQERGEGQYSAVQEVERDHGIPVVPVVSLDVLVEYLTARSERQSQAQAVSAYRQQYGVASA